MNISGYELLWLFMGYSFAGWVLETIAAALKQKKLVNRGVLSGPVCTVYGFAAMIMTISFSETDNGLFWTFIGCMIDATVIEWITGKLLERMGSGRWWDYSGHRWNLDGYICLTYSLLWGILGTVSLKFANPLFLAFFRLIPGWLSVPLLWVSVGVIVLDTLGSLAVISKWSRPMQRIRHFNFRLAGMTGRMAQWIGGHVEHRLERAYPQAKAEREKEETKTVFAAGCCFYKLVMLFFIGAFLGDITEMIFCRITAGRWMSRSSLVWGQFSIVWGFAFVLATALLYRYRDRSDGFLFLFGTVMGGAYEYFCSVFTELVFGTVFWDYSEIPFNLGGRINLLYCFFWGFAAVIWLKWVYPFLSSLIERIPITIGTCLSWIVIVFMVCNMAVSGLALYRYEKRAEGAEPQTAWEQYMDEHYDDERMERIYPNAKMQISG